MQEVGGAGSGSRGGAGETGAGLQMDDTGAVTAARRVEEGEEPGGGVKCPLLSGPPPSLAGDFLFTDLTFDPPPPLCCWRHFARRFLNHT